jgi:RNA polymerase-interacting CarD/CdnL/TRCF family regulator
VQDLTRWNDTSGRSLEEVRALLDAAIGRVHRELQVSDAH